MANFRVVYSQTAKAEHKGGIVRHIGMESVGMDDNKIPDVLKAVLTSMGKHHLQASRIRRDRVSGYLLFRYPLRQGRQGHRTMTKTPKTPLYSFTPGDRVRVLRNVLDNDPAASLYGQHQPLKASEGDVGTVDTWLLRNRLLLLMEGVPVVVHQSDLERVEEAIP